MPKKGANANKKKQRQAYKLEGRYSKNKKLKLQKHLNKFPKDKQAKEAIEKIKEYRRKRPYNNSAWSKTDRYHAQLYACAGLNGHKVKEKPRKQGD